MKNKIIKLITAIIVTIGISAGFITMPTFATGENDASSCTDVCSCPHVDQSIKNALSCDGTSGNNANDIIINIINGVLGLLAVVAVIVIVIGGVQYMTSAGDPGKTKKAKDTILYACIGLIIAALAAIIVNFVINLVNQNNDPSGNAETSEEITESNNP